MAYFLLSNIVNTKHFSQKSSMYYSKNMFVVNMCKAFSPTPFPLPTYLDMKKIFCAILNTCYLC